MMPSYRLIFVSLFMGATTTLFFAAAESNVLPPSPGDQPESCSPSAVQSSCGIERSCESAGSQYYCLHKTLSPVTIMDFLAWLVVGGCCLVAATAGIGGGGLNLPVLIIILNFTTKEASVLSNIAVLGNCVGQLLINISDRSLRGKGDAVKRSVVMILPALIAGGSISIAVEALVPSTMILILALITLLFASFKTYFKAAKLKELENNFDAGHSNGHNTTEYSDSSVQQQESEENNNVTEDIVTFSNRKGYCHQHAIEILLALCWALNASTFFVIHSGIFEKCSTFYYVFVLLPTIFAAVFLWMGRNQISRDERVAHDRDNGNHEPTLTTPLLELEPDEHTVETVHDVIGDSDHDDFNVLVWWLPLASSIVGFLSALLGIGGGELVGPMLLLLNMRPEQSSATTATISLLNSATNTLHYAVTGMIISPGYASSFALMGFLGGIGGRSLAMGIATRSGKTSIIAFSLLLVLCVAASLVAFELFTTPMSWEIDNVC
mmetsp:Transcript_26704/g.39492  ORF Transcript_26704/g.39492 Transcript_26704/m.39492 type:complete len:494 (+) Transcript_26704:83-1564(+)